jgi:hypothetical protein
VTPRYDDSGLQDRENHCIVDAKDQETYDAQWENAISLFKEEKIITITSWNEYPERTANPTMTKPQTTPTPGSYTIKQEIILRKHER